MSSSGYKGCSSVCERQGHTGINPSTVYKGPGASPVRQRSVTVQPGGEMAQGKHECLQKSEQGWCCKDGDGLFSVVAVEGH